jgi:hypothetical protein
VRGLDAESDQRADGETESDGENDVADAGHGKGSLDVAKVIGINADSAKERREAAHVDAPVVRRICARVDWACLAFRAIEHVVREDARVNHGECS